MPDDDIQQPILPPSGGMNRRDSRPALPENVAHVAWNLELNIAGGLTADFGTRRLLETKESAEVRVLGAHNGNCYVQIAGVIKSFLLGSGGVY